MTDGIQQISDEELSRWICEKLEPLAKIAAARVNGHVYTEFWNAGDGWNGRPPQGAFKPRDMVNDAQMTLMLLEKMKEPQLWKETPTLWQLQPDYMQEGPDKNPNYVLVSGERIGRVVAEAFALAQGYPETLDRT